MLPKIIGVVFGILAIGIFAWKFRRRALPPLNHVAAEPWRGVRRLFLLKHWM